MGWKLIINTIKHFLKTGNNKEALKISQKGILFYPSVSSLHLLNISVSIRLKGFSELISQIYKAMIETNHNTNMILEVIGLERSSGIKLISNSRVVRALHSRARSVILWCIIIANLSYILIHTLTFKSIYFTKFN